MATRLTVNPMTITGSSVRRNLIAALGTPDGHAGGVAALSTLQSVFNSPLLGGF